MISRDKKLLLAGTAAGILIAVTFMGVFFYRQQSARAATQSLAVTPAHSQHADSEPQMVGTDPGTTVQLDPGDINAAGVQLARVTTSRLKTNLDAVGRVEQPEAQLATIPSRVSGRIDKLFVQFTGESVRRGQPIAEIYSPELASSAEEYRLAIENRDHMRGSSQKDAFDSAEQLVEASRKRLELWGVSENQIAAAASSASNPHVTLYANAGGSVVERKVTRGQYVNAGDALFTVADLGTVWVKADVYEFQLPQVRPGQTVEITSDALPDKVVRGRVDFVEPEANPQTRTIPVHIHVPNPSMRLRPGMYIRARFVSPADRDTIVVPRSAVLDTGTRKLVYIAKDGGVFEAREIQAGTPTEDLYPVLSGLKVGEQVVTNGNFLIDSQTRLTGGMTGLFGGSKEYTNEKTGGASITLTVEPEPAKGGSENTFQVRLIDGAGQVISDAQVAVTLVMPAMPTMNMPEMRNSFPLPFAQGVYRGKGNVGMAGSWNVSVKASRNGQVIATYRSRLRAE